MRRSRPVDVAKGATRLGEGQRDQRAKIEDLRAAEGIEIALAEPPLWFPSCFAIRFYFVSCTPKLDDGRV